MKRLALVMILASGGAMADDIAAAGNIAIEDAWARASVAVSRPAAAYLTLRNDGVEDDRLLTIATPAAAMPMIHETRMSDGMASMAEAGALAIPSGTTVTMEPGGLHVMLMNLTAPLAAGDTLSLTLTFEVAGEVTVDVPVLPLTATGPEG